MGGYSDDAVDALVAGKSINLILFDGNDMRELARPGGIGIANAIATKLRAAAETGTPFLSVAHQVQPGTVGPEKVFFLVEGVYDLQLINSLSQRANNPREFTIIPAGGLFNVAPAGLALLHLNSDIGRLVIVIDGDGRRDSNRHEVSSRLEAGEIPDAVEVETLVLEPNFEQALGVAGSSKRRPTPTELSARVAEIDLGAVAADSADLRRLFQILGILE